MVSLTTKSKSVRLGNEVWRKLDWIADNEGITVNDFIKAAIAEKLDQFDIPEPGPIEGQKTLFE